MFRTSEGRPRAETTCHVLARPRIHGAKRAPRRAATFARAGWIEIGPTRGARVGEGTHAIGRSIA